LEQYRQLTGTLQERQKITGQIQINNALNGIVQIPNLSPPIHPTYDGEYSITPRFYEQKLETKEKLMTDDVTVDVIPVHEVTNPAGGITVTIG
jgi:hypothetical protein